MSRTVGVIDYGVGNIRSVESALRHLGARSVLSSDPATLLDCDCIILPGVGAFGHGMAELEARSLTAVIQQAANENKPLLGICLGMQLLSRASTEFGQHAGLGILDGVATGLEARTSQDIRLPHVAWQPLMQKGSDHGWLFAGTAPQDRFYFIHSFAVEASSNDIVATACYDGIEFAAVIGRGSILGVQFHPEKSGAAGLCLLKNFVFQGA